MGHVINKFLLAGDTSMPEIHLRHLNLNLLTVLVDHLLSMNKELKSLKKLVIQTMCTKMN